MIDPEHLRKVCLIGQGVVTCRFIVAGAEGLTCAKGTNVESILKERGDRGQMLAVGDICSGPPNFKTGEKP